MLLMKWKKSVLKKIKATVMPQTFDGLQKMMEENQLTMGEVIDRLVLQLPSEDTEYAVSLAIVSSQVKYRNFRQKVQSFLASIISCNGPVVG